MLFRESQKRKLETYLHPKCIPPTLILHGPSDTGKTSLVLDILQKQCSHLDPNYTITDCARYSSARYFFEALMEPLTTKDDIKNSSRFMATKIGRSRVSHVYQFASWLEENILRPGQTFFIVLENFLALSQLDAKLLPGLCRMQDMFDFRGNGHRCCLVCTTKYFPKDFFFQYFKGKDSGTITIHFPQYTHEQLVKILVSKKIDGMVDDEWRDFVKYLIGLFSHTRYLQDFFSIIARIEPDIQSYLEESSEGDGMCGGLLDHVKEKLTDIRNQTERKNVLKRRGEQMRNDGHSCLGRNNEMCLEDISLALATQYILLAGFLASYILPKKDRRLFVSERMSRRRAVRKNPGKERDLLQEGPKAFTYERLLAIFEVLWRGVGIHSKRPEVIDIQQQVRELTKLGLFSQVNRNFNEQKYLCNISYNYAFILSREVDCDITSYLPKDNVTIASREIQ